MTAPTRPRLARLLLVSLTLAAFAAPAPGAAAQQAGDDPYPVTIENCGRTLTFDGPPERVVLPYHPIAEMFVGLGLADRAIGRVGAPGGGGLTEPPILPEHVDAFAGIPVISDDVYPPPREKMLALRADFFLAYGAFDYDPAGGYASIEDLAAAGTQVYSTICPPGEGGSGHDGERVEEVYRALLDLGRIFGVEARAEARVAEMKAQIADVRARVASQPRVRAMLYYGGATGPLGVAGNGGINHQLMELAGADNVFGDTSGSYAEVSLEEVAASGAEAYVIIADYRSPTPELDVSDETEFLFSTFPNLPATRDKRVVATDYFLTSPGWRTAQTVEDLARQLHPDAFD